MSENKHSVEHPLLKILSQDSALAMYIKTRKPHYLWSFFFAMLTFVLLMVFIIFFLTEVNSEYGMENTRVILKFIISGSITMSLSRIFVGDLRSFLGLVITAGITTFIYHLS